MSLQFSLMISVHTPHVHHHEILSQTFMAKGIKMDENIGNILSKFWKISWKSERSTFSSQRRGKLFEQIQFTSTKFYSKRWKIIGVGRGYTFLIQASLLRAWSNTLWVTATQKANFLIKMSLKKGSDKGKLWFDNYYLFCHCVKITFKLTILCSSLYYRYRQHSNLRRKTRRFCWYRMRWGVQIKCG